MKKLTLILLMFCAFTIKAQQNLVLNGSFELNNPIIDSITGLVNCWNDFFPIADYNSTIFYSTHFGDDNTSTLWKIPCLACSPQTLWGDIAKNGSYVLSLYGRDELVILPWAPDDTVHNTKQGKISLALETPLSSEERYKLSFWIKDPPPEPNCMYQKNNYVNVGISNYDNQLGRHLITTNYGDTIWQEYTYIFETQMAEEYITVTAGVNDTIDYAVFIDHFVVTETEEPLTTGVNEVAQQEKNLVKIVDVLGRETKAIKNTPLFYIYSDGTVEKRIVIE